MVSRGDQVVGRLPFVEGRRAGVSALLSPPLTPALGPWIDPGEGSYTRQLGNQFQIFDELLDGLPSAKAHFQPMAPELLSAMPLHWRGFQTSTRYTYRIEDLTDLDAVQSGFSSSTRRSIRKAEKIYDVTEDVDIEVLVRLRSESLSRAGVPIDEHDPDLVRRIDEVAAERGQRQMIAARTADGAVDAVFYNVFDGRCLYQLMSGQRADAQPGGPSLLQWHSIQRAAQVSGAFDHEGSMLPGVERFVRGFGGRQVPYLFASRLSRWLAPVVALRDSISGRMG